MYHPLNAPAIKEIGAKMTNQPESRRKAGVRDIFFRLLFTRQWKEKECTHFDMIRDVSPSTDVCEDCVALGDTWPALRLCMTCGYIGCCEDAKNQHALKHFEETGHPIIQSMERFMDWQWCYIDNAVLVPHKPGS